MMPNGLTRLRNALMRDVLPDISRMMLFSLTSTIRAPNWFASTCRDCRCWCRMRSASLGVSGFAPPSPPAPAPPGGVVEDEDEDEDESGGWCGGRLDSSKCRARTISRSSLVCSACARCAARGSCEGPPTSWSSRYSGPRMDTLTRSSSREIVRVSV